MLLVHREGAGSQEGRFLTSVGARPKKRGRIFIRPLFCIERFALSALIAFLLPTLIAVAPALLHVRLAASILLRAGLPLRAVLLPDVFLALAVSLDVGLALRAVLLSQVFLALIAGLAIR